MRLPDEANPPADVRSTDLRRELQRCASLLRWVQSLEPEAWIGSRPPELGDDLVTVVVPMYQASRWIEDCLKGLLAQTHRNLEIFCVDDCSSDGTYDLVVERFGRDRRLCVIELARNVGPFQISNWVGGRLARAPRIAWQDADNVSHPRRIEQQCRWMDAEAYAITSTCVHHFFSPELPPFRPSMPPFEANGLRHELFLYVSLVPAGPTAEAPADPRLRGERVWRRNELKPATVDATFAYRRSGTSHAIQVVDTGLFRAFGGFTGRTKVSEDADFDWRVAQFHDLGVLPRVLGSRRAHASSLTRHPETGHSSVARQVYEDERLRLRDEVTREIAAGNVARARELCCESLHHGEIEVRRAHLGFDVRLS